MSDGWEWCELASVGVTVLDCEHKTPPDAGSGYPYIAIPNLVDGKIDLAAVRRITEDHFREWTRRTKPSAGDVIVTRRGRVGDSAVVSDGLECAIGQNLVILRSIDDRIDQRFLRWATRGPLWAREVDRLRNVGAVFDSLHVRDIAKLRIPVPPPSEQRLIAATLGALDDKIDSNQRLATLIEETAVTMFRARFVDFVEAQEVEDGEVGRIPRRWRVGVLGDLATIAKGSIEPSSMPDVLFEHFSIPAFDKGRRADLVNGLELLSSKTLMPDGECVLLSKLNPATKRIWLPQPTGQGPAICSPEFLVLVPRPTVPNAYLYAALSADQQFQDDLLARVSGTTGSRQRIKPADVLACRVVVPDAAALAAWDRLAQPMYGETLSLLAEERTIASIRDTLLPKLLSGRIRVPDTDDPEEVIGPVAEQLAAGSS